MVLLLTLLSMTLPRFIRSYILVFVLFMLLDGFWHAGLMADFYADHLQPALMGARPTIDWAIVALIAINAVTTTYIIQNHIEHDRSIADLLFTGGLLGFTVAASINLLNMSLLGWWDIILVIVDISWGTALGILGAIAVFASSPKKKGGFFGFIKRKK